MTRVHYLVFALALASLPDHECLASDHVVSVHIVDAKTGNAISRGNLEMRWGGSRSQMKLRQEIRPDGTAEFKLDDPLPSRVQIYLGKSMGYWYECSQGDYDTKEVVERGVSEQADIWPKTKFANISSQFHPKPGEIYYFACHIPFGEFVKTWFEGFK